MKLGTSIASLVLLGTACGVTPDSTGPGAHMAAPATNSAGEDDHSGSDGPRSPTSLSTDSAIRAGAPAPTGDPCGPSRCQTGEFCCNESCGICAPRGGLCLQQQCGPKAAVLTECDDDSTCRIISSYCDGCQCLARGVLDADPACHATLVACILDPCHHQHAACVNGVCSAVRD